MFNRWQSFWARYVVALLAVAAATALRLLLDPYLGERYPLATILLAVLFSAWYGGFGPALTAAIAGAWAAWYFLLPDQAQRPGAGNSLWGLLIYSVVSLAIASLGGLILSARRRIARQIEEAHRQQERRNVRLAVMQILAQADTLRGAAAPIVRAACEGFGWSAGAFWVVDPRMNVIRCFDTWGRPDNKGERFLPSTRQAAFTPGESLPGRVWRLRQPVWIEDLTADPQFVRGDAAAADELRGALAFPIYAQDQVLGVMEFLSPVIREPDSDLLEMVMTLGGQIGQFMGRRRAEEERARSEKELADFFNNATIPSHSVGPDGIILMANQAELDLLGYSREEYIRHHIAEFHVDRAAIDDIFNRLSSGETVLNFEARLRCKDGSVKDVLIDSSVLWEDGRFVHTRSFTRDITQYKQAQERLRESAQRLRLALDAGRMSVWQWDLASNQVEWSENLEALQSHSGGALSEPFDKFLQLIHPADREHMREELLRAVEQRSDFDHEFRSIWPDGSVHWMAGKGRVYCDGERPRRMIGVALDITDRKRVEQTAHFLADASEALAGLVDLKNTLQRVASLAVPFFADWCLVDLVDAEGLLRRLTIAHVDPAKVQLAQEIYERWPASREGSESGPAKIVRTGCPELISEITDEMLSQTIQDPHLLAIMRKLGLRSYIGAPLAVRGKVLGVLNFISAESGRRYDATDLEAAEDLAHRAAVAIENAQLYHSLREADRRKDEFLAVLAHELRNPLAPIASALQIMKQPSVDAATLGDARDMAERQMSSLSRLVDDLLDVSRIMRGKIELRKERIELAKIVERAVETVWPQMQNGGHDLTVSIPDQPLWLDADPVRMAQVLANLLSNAAKYTETAGKIWLTAKPEDGEVAISVRDDGIGIAPDMLPRLFDMFMQVAPGKSRSQGGLGIGLTLVKRLVQMHGGSVEAHSAGLGKGSEFVVKVPVASPVTSAESRDRDQPAAQQPGASRRVLVVDDNVDAAESMAILLRLMGHDVRTVHGGEAALEAVASEQPELVLLDIGMPGLNGYEVARRLRAEYGPERLKLIALTGWGQEQDRRRSKEVGFDHHLTKPVELSMLQTVLDLPAAAPI
jgi:PAS domain S-box-containing protein